MFIMRLNRGVVRHSSIRVCMTLRTVAYNVVLKSSYKQLHSGFL